mmetsp:Transcript_62684/g.123938  ORF Transcript_62684/g.123938 Transcript_62684/m.123938 type:complete len:253 (-) Transcript_62684:16-774(-)
MRMAYCTARACTTAKSTASGCRWLARTAASTAQRSSCAPHSTSWHATPTGEIRIAPPLAKDPPGKGKNGGMPVSSGETPSRVACITRFAVGGQPRKCSLSLNILAQLFAHSTASICLQATIDAATAKHALVSSVYIPVRTHCFATAGFCVGPAGTKFISSTPIAGRYVAGSLPATKVPIGTAGRKSWIRSVPQVFCASDLMSVLSKPSTAAPNASPTISPSMHPLAHDTITSAEPTSAITGIPFCRRNGGHS